MSPSSHTWWTRIRGAEVPTRTADHRFGVGAAAAGQPTSWQIMGPDLPKNGGGITIEVNVALRNRLHWKRSCVST